MQLSTYLAPPPAPLRAANESAPVPEPPRSAAIVTFRPAARRRRSAAAHERRGEILLFLGVRYSRAS